MYRIAVVAEQEREAFHYAEQIARFCGEKGMFPKIEPMMIRNAFFDAVGRDAPTNAVIALSGVAGLNAAEHLRSLCPRLPDHLVQRSGLFAPRFPPAGGLFPAQAGD